MDSICNAIIFERSIVTPLMQILSAFSCKSMIVIFVRALIRKWKREVTKDPFHGCIAMGTIIQIVIGTAYFHHFNILHQDLKADNIFMNMDGDDDTSSNIFIGDFDVASTIEGTSFWRAPEMLQVVKAKAHLVKQQCIDLCVYNSTILLFTIKSKVYSFAMVCYEILTGDIPFVNIKISNYNMVLYSRRPKLPSNLNPKMKKPLNKY